MAYRILIAAVLLAGGAANAAVYRWVDPEGLVHYTDRPVPGAEEIKTGPLATYPGQRPGATSRSSGREQGPRPEFYPAFSIISPANDATIRDNTGAVAIQLDLSGDLLEDHAIALVIDGERQPETVRTSTFTISNLDRGTHTLQAMVVDGEGNEVASTAATTIHMQRAAIPPPPSPPPPPPGFRTNP